MPITKKVVFAFPDGSMITEYCLKNETGFELRTLDYGCTITSLFVPDKKGNVVDVVLGFDQVEEYFHSAHYVGCIVGRYANRIAHGIFTIDDTTYTLPQNNRGHHLHGGVNGLDKKLWEATLIENNEGCGVDFFYLSPHGEEGYPGNLSIRVRYFLRTDGTVLFTYSGSTDQSTIINLTQHSYFNLNGAQNILGHALKINADQYLATDDHLIPNGELLPVEGTGLDFRAMTGIGKNMKIHASQVPLIHGYDHTLVLRKEDGDLTYAASLYEPASGRLMEIFTTEPAVQLYTANFLEGLGKHGMRYGPCSGVCLEMQHFPDSPNHLHFPSVKLQPGELYESTTVLKFTNSQS